MVHGVFDPVMPPYTGRDYAEMVRKAGGKAEVVTIPDAAHFDLVIPTTPAWKEIAGIVAREIAAAPR
jgi:pimeloyl-ACP methyl ester carboxylesterase